MKGLVLAARSRRRAAEDRVASKGGGGDFNFKKDATRNRKQNRQEQRRQDQKARKAGKAVRAAEGESAQYGYGSSASADPKAGRGVSGQGSTG
jgi:hypothetical protein